MAYDNIYPMNRATAVVTVSVERNPSPPRFPEAPYDVTIGERMDLGASVMQVQAEDDDGVRRNYQTACEAEILPFW